MVFPRIDALAEITSTPLAEKDFTHFQQRLQTRFKRYDRWKINYRIPAPLPAALYTADSTATVSLQNRAGSGIIRYELNKDKVTEHSPVYQDPVLVKKGDVLHFAVFLANGRQSSTAYFPKKTSRK